MQRHLNFVIWAMSDKFSNSITRSFPETAEMNPKPLDLTFAPFSFSEFLLEIVPL